MRNCGIAELRNCGILIADVSVICARKMFVMANSSIPFGGFARAGEYREQFSSLLEKPMPLLSVAERSVL